MKHRRHRRGFFATLDAAYHRDQHTRHAVYSLRDRIIGAIFLLFVFCCCCSGCLKGFFE